MEKIKTQSSVEVNIILSITEQEARALKELTGYGADNFLKFFYENLGRYYLEPHEKGLRSLFETIKQELPKHLDKADRAREAFATKPVQTNSRVTT